VQRSAHSAFRQTPQWAPNFCADIYGEQRTFTATAVKHTTQALP